MSPRKLVLLLVLLAEACSPEPPYEGLLCSSARPCPEGLLCRSERCVQPGEDVGEDAGEDAGEEAESDCASCDLPSAVCLENDSVYRAYVKLGACPDDPSQCVFTAFDTDCPSCSDQCLIPCREQTCDELQGGCRQAGYCVPSPSGTGAACAYVEETDSSTCTTSAGEGGRCQSGVCIAYETCDDAACDDGNPCTDDACDPKGDCVHTDNQADCDDGDLCTHGDQCSSGSCGGVRITCESDACMERACDGTASCSEQPRPIDTPCLDDGQACTRDVCDGAGTCQHSPLPNGSQCGPAASQRCCSTECVDISTDERHCGGCGTACDQGFACEPIESTPECGASYPAQVSGRCLCQGANSHCPDNRGQVCRLTQYLDGNRCVPDSTTAMPCSAGQTVEVINLCPGYCSY